MMASASKRKSLSATQPWLSLANWAAMRLNLYWAYEGQPGSMRSSGTVTSQTVWLLRQGSVRVQWRGQKLDVSKGQLLILGGDRRAHHFSEDSLLLSICFRAEWFTGQAFFDDSAPILLDAGSQPRLVAASERLVRAGNKIAPSSGTGLTRQTGSFGQFLRLRRAYLAWLETLSVHLQRAGVSLREAQPTDDRIVDAIQRIADWALDKPFSERAFAAGMRLSVPHLNRLFAAHLGMSPKGVFEQRRFDAARERLLTQDTPIKTIAYQLGFHDVAHFSNWFYARAHARPSRFRKERATPWLLT